VDILKENHSEYTIFTSEVLCKFTEPESAQLVNSDIDRLNIEIDIEMVRYTMVRPFLKI